MGGGNQFRLLYHEPSQYYRSGKAFYVRMNNTIAITLKFPLVRGEGDQFVLYSIQYYPMILHNNEDGHMMILEEETVALAIERDKVYYMTFNERDWIDFQRGKFMVENRVFKKDGGFVSCVVAILLELKENIQRNCQYVIWKRVLHPDVFHLEGNLFLMVNVHRFNLICDEIRIPHEKCASCVVHVPNNCTIHGMRWMIMKILSGRETFKNARIRHLTNIPLLMHFFGEEEIKYVTSDTLTMIPARYTIPKFRFFKSNTSVARTEKIKLDLQKVTKAVKNDALIYHELSEIMLQQSHEENTLKEFANSIPGIATLTTTGILLLLMINGVYLLIKYRKMMVMLAVVMAKAERVNGVANECKYNLQLARLNTLIKEGETFLIPMRQNMIKDCAEAQSVKESGKSDKNQTIPLDEGNGRTTGHEDDRKNSDNSKQLFLDQIRMVYKEGMLTTLVIMAVGVLI